MPTPDGIGTLVEKGNVLALYTSIPHLEGHQADLRNHTARLLATRQFFRTVGKSATAFQLILGYLFYSAFDISFNAIVSEPGI